MPVRAPLMEADQHGSIRIQDLTKVIMARRRLSLAKERLVPFEAAGNVAYANDRPCAFHRISAVGLTPSASAAALLILRAPSAAAVLAGHVVSRILFQRAEALRAAMLGVPERLPEAVRLNHIKSFEHKADRIESSIPGERSWLHFCPANVNN